jgi:hypothetical protein
MALVYLVNKPQISCWIIRWLHNNLDYDFKIVYKFGRSHSMVDALSRLSNQAELVGVYLIRPLMFTCSHYSKSGYKVFMITC